MRLLVLGSGGMAGHTVALRLVELGHSVTGLARQELPFCETIVADVRDIEKVVNLTDYDAVVNCIGVLVEFCEENPDEAVWLNAYLPRLLAKLTKNVRTKIVHLSTDCVFAGDGSGGYNEDSFPDAEYLYGRSKALGELKDNQNLTFRMSIVGPDRNRNGIGLFNWFMQQNRTVDGYAGAIWSGVTTLTLADAIHAALEQNLSGLYHLVNNQTISKYELLKLFHSLRYIPLEIIRNETVRENKSLINTRTDFAFTVPGYADMVCGMGEWIVCHSELYPQYHIKK